MRDPWLVAVLVVSAALAIYKLDWGLPNGNHSWAADSLGPLTVLSIGRRSTLSWNSGWFYFKYPLGYPLVLLAAYAPYLGFLVLGGQLRRPVAVYPYGFAEPEAALHAMALIGRIVSVACVLATVALTYGIGTRLFGRKAGLLAAFWVATAYPIVYYAHTTNLDAAYLLWLTLALWAAAVACESGSRWPYVALGVAAAMAVSTKEQAFAFLLPLPAIIAVDRLRTLPSDLPLKERCCAVLWNPGTRAGLAATVLVFSVVNNLLFNPEGFVNRVLYLSGRQIPGVSARLAPVEFSVFKGLSKEWQYLLQLFDGIESSLGLPLLLAAVVGVVYVATQHRRAAFILFTPLAAQYYLSLRTLDLITLRYTLPLSVILVLSAAAICTRGLSARRRRLGSAVIVGLTAFGLMRAIELDLLLRNDSRSQAEAWIRENIPRGSSVEVYQKPAYLPRLESVPARRVPIQQRTIEGVRERQPDFIIISSAAKKGVTHRWNPDWSNGNPLLLKEPGAAAFLDALEDHRLSYERAAHFSQQPVLLRVRVTSLCPEISIFRRRPQ